MEKIMLFYVFEFIDEPELGEAYCISSAYMV